MKSHLKCMQSYTYLAEAALCILTVLQEVLCAHLPSFVFSGKRAHWKRLLARRSNKKAIGPRYDAHIATGLPLIKKCTGMAPGKLSTSHALLHRSRGFGLGEGRKGKIKNISIRVYTQRLTSNKLSYVAF